MFKIIGVDGREYGPVPAETIRQWINEGRANGASRVLPEGGNDWQPLSTLSEFAGALRGASTGVPPAFGSGAPPGGDPGATPLPPDIETRDYSLDIFGCIGRAWSLVTGPYAWTAIGGTAVWLIIQMGIATLSAIPFVGTLFSLVSMVVGGALIGGVYSFMFRCTRGQPAEVGNIFDGFRCCFLQLFLGYLVTTLLTFFAMLPGMILIIPGAIMLDQRAAEVLAVILIAIGVFIAIIPAIFLSTSWAFTLPLIMDKRLEFWPAMRLSFKLVCKHWLTVFVFMVVIGLINLVGLLLCCIGLFFTVPLGIAATCFAYEIMFSERAGRQTAAPNPSPAAS